jgi:hypothetical protein
MKTITEQLADMRKVCDGADAVLSEPAPARAIDAATGLEVVAFSQILVGGMNLSQFRETFDPQTVRRLLDALECIVNGLNQYGGHAHPTAYRLVEQASAILSGEGEA